MVSPDLLVKAEYVQPRIFNPRLGPFHAVLWLVVTATLLGLQVARDASASGVWPTTVESSLVYALPALSAAFCAMILVTAGAIVRQRQVPETPRLQPGHWLLIVSAALYLAALPFTLLGQAQDLSATPTNLALIGPCAYSLFGAAVYAIAASQQPETEWWRKSFRTFAVAHVLGGITLLAFAFPATVPNGTAVWFLGLPTAVLVLAAGGSFLLSATKDINTQRQRGSLHWLGVMVVAVSVAIQIAAMLLKHRS
jgi:hypothetical protein